MALTPYIVAGFANQPAGRLITAYVPQSGDMGATFIAAARNNGGQLLFSGATPDSLITGSSTSNDQFYFCSPVLSSSHGQMDFQQDFTFFNAPSIVNGIGFTIGDDNTGNNFLDVLTWVGGGVGNGAFHITNHVSGNSTDLATPAYPFTAGTTYRMIAQIRGTAGAYTINLICGPVGGTMTTLVNNLSVPSLVMVARYIGLRAAYSDGTQTASSGSAVLNYYVSDYSSGGGGSISAPTVTANGTTGATVTVTAETGGTAPYSYQFQRAPVSAGSAGTFANIGTPGTALSYNDTGLTQGTTYAYRVIATDSASTPVVVTSTTTMYTVPVVGFTVTTTPASMVLVQGQALTLAVTLAASGGYTGTDTLSCTGLPTGVTASFSPASVTNGAGSSTLTLAAAGNAITGALEIGVQGSDGTMTVSALVMLQVNPPSGVVYPMVSNVLDSDLVTITRSGTTDQVAASVLKAYLAS